MRSISLTSAVLISINIIIGAGLFINPAPLAYFANGYGFLAYIVSACILLPLILCIAELATLKPIAGGLYVYAQSYISPLAGFTSSWSYFLGKSTSAAILAYTFCTFLKSIFPALLIIPTTALTIAVLFFLAFLNIAGVKIGGSIQWFFISVKILPIAFVLLTGVFFIKGDVGGELILMDFGSAFPIAVFALCGFEAICAIAHLIEKPHRNVRRAMLLSFFLVALASSLFQFFLYQILGEELVSIKNPLLAYAEAVFPSAHILKRLLNALVYSSILGASFGMLTSNCWNLHTIAKHQHLPWSNLLLPIKNETPWVCLLLEVLFASLIILLKTEQIPLQNMAVFGMTVSYFMSTLAALRAARVHKSSRLPRYLPMLSFASCSYIILLCADRIIKSGASLVFLIILASGLIFAYLKAGKLRNNF